MNRTLVWLLAGGVSLALLVPSAGRADEKQIFRAGAAASNITPALGGDIVGGFLPIPSKHIHDELHARCLVLDDGKTKLAMVVCDLLGIDRRVSDEARRQIAERASIPRDNVLICATHTHSATSAIGSDHFKYDQPGDEYQQFVARRIADGVTCAANNLRPAELAFLKVEAPEHVFNRRWFMRPGTIPASPFADSTAFPSDLVKMNPEPGSPNLLDPAGPTDPVVSVLSVRGLDGHPISLFAAYSLHYVGGVGNAHISADYFAVFCDELTRLLDAERLDPPFVAMLANGTSGDINNINFRQPRPAQEPYAQMRAVASDLAKRVQEALANARYSHEITLDARYRELSIGCRRPNQEQVAWAKKTLAERPLSPGRADLGAIYAERTLRMADYPAALPMPLQVLRLGSVCIGTMPNEVFCEIGLEFKRRSPFADSFMVSLAHGYYGYLPTPRHHDLGGYETWMGTNRLEKQASEKMLAELLDMAGEMKKDKKAE
ncbi:MAG TPA: neutral/alkaline non-lysosomal ceramidase N-terminal domain-containing protein [Pirellulales bacterium]|nr:neutral/alkaline non-lysosomal ceramidase N-terminal domain-containing protein [Pirellulales bacterium]